MRPRSTIHCEGSKGGRPPAETDPIARLRHPRHKENPMITPHQATSRRGIGGMLAGAVAASLLLAGCGRDLPLATDGEPRSTPAGPALQLNAACAGGGQVHPGGPITTTEHWHPSGNPHHVSGAIVVGAGGHLRIHPGTRVCFLGSTGLAAVDGGTIGVDGRDTALVVLTAADLADGWLGITVSDTPSASSFARNARVEYASQIAFHARDRHLLLLDSVHIRQAGVAAYLESPRSRIRFSVVDTTTIPSYGAVTLGDSARFNQTTIRGAAGYGLLVNAALGVQLGSGRIEGSGGIGLYAGDGVAAAQPIRVVGSGAHGAVLSIGALSKLYPDAATQDSLLGNARDTVYVVGGDLHTTVHAQANLPWRVIWPITVSSGGILRGFAGAHLALEHNAGIAAEQGGRLAVRGSPGNPVVFTATDTATGWNGIRMEDSASTSSVLINARIEYTSATAVNALFHRVVIDSTVIRQTGAAVLIWGTGSRISRTRIDTTRVAGGAAVFLVADAIVESTLIRGSAGPGMELWGPADIRSCEIRENAGDGIVMTAYPVDVHNCNLVDNGGVGIRSAAPYTPAPSVTNNWWGDAAGPAGPNGDGVSGQLTFSPWRTAPYVLPYVP
jgi:hypothetical protein